MDNTEITNIAETLAREMKTPIEIISEPGGNIKRVALPPGWTMQEKNDDSILLAHPRRKIAKVKLHDADSFIDYVKRHGSMADSTVWCVADYLAGKVSFLAILNDHGEDESKAAWQDHRASFAPKFSEEWNRWISQHKHALTRLSLLPSSKITSKTSPASKASRPGHRCWKWL